MFSEEFLRSVLARVDIVDVIGDYLPLRKGPTSSNLKCLCPFHQERHPSFEVIRNKQFYCCHGCGVSGNVFAFLMDYLHVSYAEAITLVCRRYRIPVRHDTVRNPVRETARKKRSRVRRRAHRKWVAYMKEYGEHAMDTDIFLESEDG